MEETFTDYYKVLQCERTASTEELKKSYQRLALLSHPDKSDPTSKKSFLLIQKAWSVLRDPQSRKQYDATLTCHDHSDILLYDTILLLDMTFDERENVYTYSCRCGGTYLLESSDTVPKKIVIACDECSFSIQVNR